MERTYSGKFFALIACVLLATGCATKPKDKTVDANVVLAEAKPVIDNSKLGPCSAVVPKLEKGADFQAVAESFGSATNQLRKCACQNIELRNMLCKLTRPGCDAAPVCEVPHE